MQQFTLKLGKTKITCEALGVREGMALKGRVTKVLADGLKAALGKDVADIFKTGITMAETENKDASQSDDAQSLPDTQSLADALTGLAVASIDFRQGVDWDEFTDLVIDGCQMCKVETKDLVQDLDVDDLSFGKSEHYKVFFWFLECQLGNFIGWKKLKPLIMEHFQAKIRGGTQNSRKSALT